MFRIAIALLLAAPIIGQTASVTHYGTPCPVGAAPLTTQGLPRLGTTFTVTGIHQLSGTLGMPSMAGGPVLLSFGFSRGSGTAPLPAGIPGSGCPLLASTNVYLLGDANGDVNLQVPNNTRLLGLRFYLQSLTPFWIFPWVSPAFLVGGEVSDGVECVIGT